MTNTKIFKKDIYTALALAVKANEIELTIPQKGRVTQEELVNFFNHEIELVSKKATKKPTEKQKENDRLREVIIETLQIVGKATITELQKANAELGELQNQKVSALMRQLIADGTVTRTVDKRKSYFSL